VRVRYRTIWALVFLLIFILYFPLFPREPDSKISPKLDWRIGEELIYKVKYLFFTLGTLKFQVLDSTTINNRKAYHTRIYIDSNPALPFVNLHDIYESYVDAEEIYSHRFISYEKKSDYTLFTRYDMDYQTNTIHIIIQKWTENDTLLVLDSTATIPEKVQDSLSLLYFARATVKSKCEMDVPVFAFNEFKYAYINFTGEKRNKKGIQSYYLDGKLKFVGVAGIKEGFKGWFSPDSQSVPLFANMKAFIGSVGIKIQSWKNWQPSPAIAKKLISKEMPAEEIN